MRREKYSLSSLKSMLREEKVATLAEIKTALGTSTTMTAFRKLKRAGYYTSYSHRGRYYALQETVQFDERGLWTFGDAHFSKHGTLKDTLKNLIDKSEKGYSAFEATNILRVDTGKTHRELIQEGSIVREKFDGVYIYYNGSDANKRRQQQLLRKNTTSRVSDEMKAAIIIFYSLLDEKERRLFSGLESLRLGYGGDSEVAQLLGLDAHTVAKGRKELFASDCTAKSQRRMKSGRKSVKKNARNSDCD